jgi:8-oxo-dGTP diphosphatase
MWRKWKSSGSSTRALVAKRVTIKRIEVAAGLVFRNGLLLITQRRPDDHLGGLWEFPGGKREPTETYEECLRRELREELDIVVEVQALVDSLSHDYPDKSVHLKFFRCGWLQNEPQKIHVHDFAWVKRGELSKYAFPAADARLLNLLQNSPGMWA